MAKSSYDESLRRLLISEGGYTNHPSDPGGPTNFGITIFDYRKYVKPNATAADVKAMRLDEAKTIYRAKYWDAQRCDELPAGLDYSVFDYGVNSGIGRSGKVLRRILGLSDATSVVTDEVLRAVAKRNASDLIEAINDERLAFLKRLKTWPVFGAGWGRRVAEARATSLHMAATVAQFADAAPTTAPDPRRNPNDVAAKGAVPSPTGLKNAVKAAAPTGGVAAAATWHDWVAAHPWQVGAVVVVIVILAGVAIYLLNRRHQSQQEAPTPGIAVVPERAT